MIIQTGQTGLITDIAPAKLPPDAVTLAKNVLFRNGSAESIPLRLRAITMSIEPLFYFVYTHPRPQDYLVVSDGVKVLAYDVAENEIDLNAANRFTAGCKVTFCELNTVLIVNSDIDGPFFFSPSASALAPLPGWDSTWRCRIMASVRYNLVALNMTEDGSNFRTKIRWSVSAPDGSVPDDWTPAVANDAGDDILGETNGPIESAVQWRGSLWIGKTDGIYEMRYIGGQFVYSVSRRSGDIGVSAVLGMVPMRNALAMLSREDLLQYDGSSGRSISDSKINKLLLSLSNNGSFEYEDLTFAPNLDLLLVQVCGVGRVSDQTLVYSPREGNWTTFEFGGIYGYTLMALNDEDDTDKELIVLRKNNEGEYVVERFTDTYNEALEGDYEFSDGAIERVGLPLDKASMVDKVLPLARGLGFEISIGCAASQDEPIRWTPFVDINPAEIEFVPVRKVGRFMSYRVRKRARQPWALDALDVRARPAGDKE